MALDLYSRTKPIPSLPTYLHDNQPDTNTVYTKKEGLATVLIGTAAYAFIPNYPNSAPWLTPSERSVIHTRLKSDSDATNDEAFSWSEVGLAVQDVKVWLYAFAFHTMSLPLYTLSLFLVCPFFLLLLLLLLFLPFSVYLHTYIPIYLRTHSPFLLLLLTYELPTPFPPGLIHLTANHNPRHGLHICAIATSHDPAVRRGHASNAHDCDSVVARAAPRALHPGHDVARDNRLCHPAREHGAENASGLVVRGHRVGGSGDLSVRGARAVLAGGQCECADEARDGECAAD